MILALGLSVAACSSPEERARAHYESGKILIDSGDYIKAGLEFRNALKYNDKLADAWFGLATVEEKNLNWPAVSDSLQRVVELDPHNIEALIKLAKLQLAAQKWDEALKNINAANDLKKDNSDILALRAAILFRLNDRPGASADAERALALNPDNPDAHAVLAADQILDKNPKGALLFINRGLAKDPTNLGLLMFKLKVFEDTRDDAGFEAVLRQIIAANPSLMEMRQALLSFLVSRKRLADVELELRAMIKAEPDNTGWSLDLVRLIGTTKGAAAARTELEALIAAKPDVADYKLALAQVDFANQQTDAATASLTAMIAKGEPKGDVQRAQLLLAEMQEKLGRIDQAKSLIGEVLAGDAKNADALTLRGNLSLQAGDTASAVGDLREALNQRPNAVPTKLLLARALERQGAVDLANDRFVEALKTSNYEPQITLDYIDFLGRRGKGDQAETVLNDALLQNSTNPRLLAALAKIKLAKQDWVGAQAIADALKKSDDMSGASRMITGALLLGQKKYDESIAALKDVYNATPEATRPMYSLVLAYVQSGKISEAESFLQSALLANPNNADALVLLGSVKEVQKKADEAEAAYKLAVERQSANPAGYLALSKLYATQKKIAEAEATLRRGRDKLPGDFGIGLALADILQQKNDIEGAIAIYEAQLRAAPDALIVINNLASLLADYRTDPASLDQALQLSKRLESVDVPQFKDTVGWVAYRGGDYAAALRNLEAAVEKLPDLALVHYHLAMTYLALKRPADARARFALAEAKLTGGDPLKEKIIAALASVPAGN